MVKQLFIRMKTKNQLEAVQEWMRRADNPPVLLLDYELAGLMEKVQAESGACLTFLCLPDVGRQSRMNSIEQMITNLSKEAGLVVRNLDELGVLLNTGYQGSLIGDSFLYAYNREAIRFYLELFPSMRFILSDELTDRELEKLTDDVIADGTDTYFTDADPDRFLYKIYGYQPLMITNQCVNRNYTDCREKKLEFRDSKGGRFTAVSSCSQCSSTIYNGKYTSMMDRTEEIGYRNLLIDLTIENKEETLQILEGHPQGEMTRGHHYKGID